MKRNKISIERSKITRRTKGFAEVNLHKRKFETLNLGTVKKRITNRTMRTIEKHGGLEAFLVSVKRGHLTPQARLMRKKIYTATKPVTEKA